MSTKTVFPRAADRRHSLVVHRDDLEFAATVGAVVGDALDAGGLVLLAATDSHTDLVDRFLDASGTARAEAAADGRYRRLALAKLLAQIEADDDPSSNCARLLEHELAGMPTGASPVHLVGELAPTLWEHGRRRAAMALESADNRLSDDLGASILCCYRAATLETVGAERLGTVHDGFLEPCTFPDSGELALAGVLGGGALPPTVAACSAARQMVRRALAGVAASSVADAAMLIASELAANAVRHGQSPFGVQVSRDDDRVRLVIAGATTAAKGAVPFPVARTHGLGIVATLATRWGVQAEERGTIVWADLADPVPSRTR